MLNRILAVTALGLAVGLAACDQGGQEQAQTPRNQEQQRTEGTPPSAQPPAPSSQEQAPSQTPPPSQSPSGGSSGSQ